MKIVILTENTAFRLDHQCLELYADLKGLKFYYYGLYFLDRKLVYTEDTFIVTMDFGPKLDCSEEVLKHNQFKDWEIERNDKALVKVVEALGPKGLKVVEIPDGTDWEIIKVLNLETVIDKERSWM